MQKKILIVVLAVLIIGGGGYAIFHKSPTTTPTNNSTSSTASTPPKQTPAASSSIVQTKTASSVGQYLADSNGSALYTYGGDTTGVSNCNGSCLYTWPVYGPTGTSATLPANVTVITRSDSSKQYAYKGMPLYTFSSDSAGQVTGDGVSNFHIAKP